MNALKILCCMLTLIMSCGRAFPDPENSGKERESEEDSLVNTKIGYTIDDIRDRLVVISHERGTGNGFLANMDGKTYLLTNQHIILGAKQISFKTLSGEKLRPRLVELSANRDIARLLLSNDTEGLGITDETPMDSPVAVFGKNQSDNTTAELHGKVTGVGADIVEVSADFLTEHSGSPVLNTRKEVLGIASYVRESNPHAMKEGTKFEDRTRRFCYRLTGTRWQPVNWKSYNNKFGTLYRQNALFLEGIFDLFTQWKDAPMERISALENTNRDVVDWIETHNAVIRKYGGSQNDKRVFASEFSASLKNLSRRCSSQANKIRAFLKQRGLNDFLRSELESQAVTLDYLADALDGFSKRAQDFR